MSEKRQSTSFYRKVFAIWLLLLSKYCSGFYLSSRTVKTNFGNLRGLIVKPDHRSLGEVEVFLGVPYAAPPLGHLRFMPPMTPIQWNGVRRADTMPPVCPQKLPDVSNRRESLKRMPLGRFNYLQRLIPQLRNQSENCLHLNIYTPVRENFGRDPEKLSVLVYIHGESYEWNSGNPYDGTILASYGQVVVVTVNFRLGILGFLRPALNEKYVSNFGLLDQIAALHWIKGNIGAFGGNPDSVTIFGQGTGAALANLLLISPVAQASKGLFHRAILMSGSALSKWAFTWDPYKYTIQMAKALKCPLIDSDKNLVNCLREKTVEELLAVPLQIPPFTTPLGPIMDGTVIKKDRMSTLSIDSKALSKYDLLYGVTSAESFNILNASEVKYGMSKERRNRLLRAYISNTFDHQTAIIKKAVENEYLTVWDPARQESPGKRKEMELRDRVLQLLGDSQIVAPVVNMGNLHSELNRKSYFYVFNHQSLQGDYPYNQGTVHGEELAYIFGAPLTGGFSHFNLKYTIEEQFLSELVMVLWTNFAKTGNPNLPTPQGYKNEGAPFNWMENMRKMWPAYDSMSQQYLHIDMQVVTKSYYRAKKLAVWNTMIPDLISSSEIKNPILQPRKKINLVPTSPPRFPINVNPFEPPRSNIFKPVTIPPAPQSPAFSYPKEVPEWNDPSKETKKSLSDEINQSPPQPVTTGTSMSLLILIGILILCLNCFAMAAIYYKRDKIHFGMPRFRRQEGDVSRKEDSLISEELSPSVRQSSVSLSFQKEERKPKRRTKSVSDVGEEMLLDSISKTPPESKELNLKKKQSSSSTLPLNKDIKAKDQKGAKFSSKTYEHRRHKSENSIYSEVNGTNVPDLVCQRTPSVTFRDVELLGSKSINKSSSSINSIKSTNSRSSVRSSTSKTSVKSSSSSKPMKKNASCQSLPTTEYQWGITPEMTMVERTNQELQDRDSKVASMQKKKYPKVLPDVPYVIDVQSATLPKSRPHPPARSTSLTQKDIEDLEDLHAIYRNKRLSKGETSTDSYTTSNIESFYGTGGGEAPASPSTIYGTLDSSDTTLKKNRKSGGFEYNNIGLYEQNSEYKPYLSTKNNDSSRVPDKKYTPYNDSRSPRGPLATFGKAKEAEAKNNKVAKNSNGDLNMQRAVPISEVDSNATLSFSSRSSGTLSSNSYGEAVTIARCKLSSSSEQSQDISGTIKRRKQSRNPPLHDPTKKTLDKPLKSVLKQTSAYDKPKSSNLSSSVTSSASINLIPVSMSSSQSTLDDKIYGKDIIKETPNLVSLPYSKTDNKS